MKVSPEGLKASQSSRKKSLRKKKKGRKNLFQKKELRGKAGSPIKVCEKIIDLERNHKTTWGGG